MIVVMLLFLLVWVWNLMVVTCKLLPLVEELVSVMGKSLMVVVGLLRVNSNWLLG